MHRTGKFLAAALESGEQRDAVQRIRRISLRASQVQQGGRLAAPAHRDDFLLVRLCRLLATAGTLVIRLCEAGHTICTQLLPQVMAFNQELLQGLSARDVSKLDSMSNRLPAQASQTVAAHSEMPKADRRRGGRTRHVLD